jgi:uracil phosphoribosyltransferase
MSQLHLLDHPIIKHKLTYLRDKNTDAERFRITLYELSRLLAYEATRDLELQSFAIETPVMKTNGYKVKDELITVAIMRAGLGMIDGITSLLPFTSIGHIGIYRDKFIGNTVEYYFKLPKRPTGRPILIAEPMIATGDTLLASIERLKQYNVGQIKVLSLLVAPEAFKKIQHFHPDVKIYALSLEDGLNEQGYLMPGLGDAGDRLFHTK